MTDMDIEVPVQSKINPWLATSLGFGGVVAFVGLVMMVAGGKEDPELPAICQTTECDVPWTDFTPAQISGLAFLVVGSLMVTAALLVGAVCWHQASQRRSRPDA